MPNGTYWDETMLNSEKIKPITLADIELQLPEGRRAGGQAEYLEMYIISGDPYLNNTNVLCDRTNCDSIWKNNPNRT